MMTISKDIWLIRTNQMWKVKLAEKICVLSLGLFALGFGRIDFEMIFSVYVLICLVSFLWLLHSVKCPYCSVKPLQQIVKRIDLSRLNYTEMFLYKVCPECSDQVKEETSGSDKSF